MKAQTTLAISKRVDEMTVNGTTTLNKVTLILMTTGHAPEEALAWLGNP
jgi:hypothetical protein